MVTQLVLLTRRSDMSFEQFSTYWKNVHAPIGGKMPEVIKYVQYHGGVAPANGAGDPAPVLRAQVRRPDAPR